MKDFLHFNDLTQDEITTVLDRADELQRCWHANSMPQSLKGAKIALWFWGQGFRNRVAFEIGARAMGADVSFIPGELAVHEPLEDIAHYLDNWFTLLVIRCKSYSDLLKVAADSALPVINARTDRNHPCEIMGDLQYIRRERGSIEGLKVVFAGEVSNLCMSWFEATRALPIEVVQVAPAPYLLKSDEVQRLNAGALGSISVSETYAGALTGQTEVLYTDCWPHEGDRDELARLFLPYQVTAQLVDRMHPRGFFLPCPPVTRSEEVSADALAHPRCCDYAAKECLLHAQNAIMEVCLNEKF